MTLSFPFSLPRTSRVKSQSTPADSTQGCASFMNALLESSNTVVADTPKFTPKPAEERIEKQKIALPATAVFLIRGWEWFKKNQRFTATKQMRVAETVQLGDKRFIALVHLEGRRYLIGGGTSGVSLLTQLEGAAEPMANGPGQIEAGSE